MITSSTTDYYIRLAVSLDFLAHDNSVIKIQLFTCSVIHKYYICGFSTKGRCDGAIGVNFLEDLIVGK